MVALKGAQVIAARPKLKVLLDRWLEIISDPYWGERDAPWWYNEAASVSTLAAAAWSHKERALLDYRASKQRANVRWKGRADIWMDLRGEEYVGEAKIFWPSLSRRRGHARTTKMLKTACSDAKAHLDGGGTARIGVLFVAPWTRELDEPTFALQTASFIEGSLRALSESCAVAWSFRTPWGAVPVSKGYGYPGVMVALCEV
jgi:hypothetical protein